MRNIAIIVSTLLALFTACTEENVYYYRINGSGVAFGDTLYLYGLDKRYEFMDTILADSVGNFKHEIYADTIFPLSLVMPKGETFVLYAEPTLETTIFPDSADKDKWHIKGGKLQQEYDSIAARLEGLSPVMQYEEIDSFVRCNPMSEVNIMLLRRYIVESESPNNRNIREILNKIGGKLNDNDYIKYVKELIEHKRAASTILYSSAPSFNFTAIDDSTKILNARYKNKFYIINFWASWDSISCEHTKQMSRLIEKHKRDTLMMLNVSLDHDTAQWRKKVLADTILGDNVCDLKIWDNNLVIRYGISDLPYSILINPKSLNISYNTTPEKMNASLDSIIKAYKKEVEEEKKREKEREREKKRKKKKNKNKK